MTHDDEFEESRDSPPANSRQHRKVQLNPHVETHGKYSIEWSYHFPLKPGMRVESEFAVLFPSEKVPGAARASLSEANLSTTRLSFADTSSDVHIYSLKLLSDVRWVHELAVSRRARNSENSINRSAVGQALKVRKFLLHHAREYWAPLFLAKLGVILQSDLKKTVQMLNASFRTSAEERALNKIQICNQRHSLLQSLHSAHRIVRAKQILHSILDGLQFSEIGVCESQEAKNESIETQKLVTQMRDLAELAIGLVAQAVAEIQDTLAEIQHDGKDFIWMTHWAQLCESWRKSSGLISYQEISQDANLATLYFERLRELKKMHYHSWDLDIDLHPNEQRFALAIGSVAAGISATFALMSTLAVSFSVTNGRPTFSAQEQGIIAVVVFIFANVLIYIVKDQMKDFLKRKLNVFFHIRSNRWVGQCFLRNSGKKSMEENTIEVANVERECWWTREAGTWKFQLWEEFKVTPKAHSTDARIVKQVWRLPLDEILHSLDNMRYALKLPSINGIPAEIDVFKRVTFPFKFVVQVKSWKNKEVKIIDMAAVEGQIVTSGDRIFAIDILSETAR